jgi:hypothetical protein
MQKLTMLYRLVALLSIQKDVEKVDLTPNDDGICFEFQGSPYRLTLERCED